MDKKPKTRKVSHKLVKVGLPQFKHKPVEAWAFLCPACDRPHVFYTKLPGKRSWTIEGDLKQPETITVTPPLVNIGLVLPNGSLARHCHLFIRNGMIWYLPDCQHELAGQTVALPDYEHPPHGQLFDTGVPLHLMQEMDIK